MFVIAVSQCTAAGRGPTGRTGPTHSRTAILDTGNIAARFSKGRRVYAGYDHASCSSGRDDGAHRIAYAKQGASLAGVANQQVAIRRNTVYEAMVDGEGRAHVAHDVTYARHGYVESFDADAGNAFGKADGSLKKV